MPAQPSPALVALAMVELGMVSAVLGAWAWAISRLASGRGLLPPAPIRVVPWRGKHVVGMLLLYVGVQLVMPPLLFRLAGIKTIRGPGGVPDAGLLNLAMIVVNAGFLVVGPWLLIRTTGAGPSDFGIERGRTGRDVVRGLVAWPLLAPIVFGIMALATKIWSREEHPLQTMVQANPTPLTWILAAVSATVLAPAVEEFLFRGVILGWLGRWASGLHRPEPAPTADPDLDPTGIWLEPEPAFAPGHRLRFLAANVAVSALFAAMHAGVWPSPVPLFFLSLGLGVLYQRTGGLVAPIVLHATFNGLSTLMFYLILQVNPDALNPKRPGGPVPIPPEAGVRSDVDPARHSRPIGIET